MGYKILATVYGLLIFVDIGQLLSQLYFIISYSDLESDFINPMELCENMEWAQPLESISQALVTLVFIVCGEWISVLLTLPLTAWNAYRYHVTKFKYDATSIFRTVRSYRIEAFVKFVLYFILFCYFLYGMIWSLVMHSDLKSVDA